MEQIFSLSLSRFKAIRFGLASLKTNINNTTLRASFPLSLVAEFLSSVFSLPAIFPFHLILPTRFLASLSSLIVSLSLYGSYSSTFRLLPYLWTHFTALPRRFLSLSLILLLSLFVPYFSYLYFSLELGLL